MVIRHLVTGALLGWAVMASAAPARKPVVSVVRQQSSLAPLVSSAPDALEARKGLELAEQAWRVMAAALQVKEAPKDTQIHLQWVVAEKPDLLPPEEFAVRVRLEGARKVFVIERYGEVGPTKEWITRGLMNAYLQAVAWDGQDLRGTGTIPRAPYWLAEGLVQKALNRQPGEMAEIIHRLSRTGTLPKLAVVQTWEDGGEIRVERLIRRAVAYWLLRQATLTPVESESLKLWWQSQRVETGARYWEATAERETWWRQVAGNRAPQDLPILTWEQTANYVREALHFPARLKGEKESRLLSILDLPDSPEELADLSAVKEAQAKLRGIEVRAHWLWPYVLAKYEEALAAWSGGNYPLYRQRLNEALVIQQRMDAMMKGTEDFLDWFTVNYGLRVEDPEWENYRKLTREIEKAREPFSGKRATDGT